MDLLTRRCCAALWGGAAQGFKQEALVSPLKGLDAVAVFSSSAHPGEKRRGPAWPAVLCRLVSNTQAGSPALSWNFPASGPLLPALWPQGFGSGHPVFEKTWGPGLAWETLLHAGCLWGHQGTRIQRVMPLRPVVRVTHSMQMCRDRSIAVFPTLLCLILVWHCLSGTEFCGVFSHSFLPHSNKYLRVCVNTHKTVNQSKENEAWCRVVKVRRQFKMRAIEVWMVKDAGLPPTSAETEMPSVKRRRQQQLP